MALSPTKQRTLSRQPSSPSLAVGLPPPLPDDHYNNMMSPSSSSRSLAKRSRKKHPSRRGDVSSSAASSPGVSEDEWSLPITPSASTSSTSSIVDPETTPKRKVLVSLEGSKTQPRKRDNLQARLQAAAKLQKSRSQGEGLNASASIGQLVPKVKPEAIVKSTSGMINPSNSGSKDKVVVCVRIKPTQSPFVDSAYELTSTSLTLTDQHPNVQKRGGKAGREEEYTYNFDALLQHPSRTPDLYEQRVAPLVDKAMNGYNSTIFAYGQTGSGKSFTMTGVDEELGVIPCAVDGVFDAINADPERAFLLRVSYIEIYNETLRDLLNFKKGPLKDDEKPNIHFNKGKVYVDPLVEEIVSTPQDIVDLLEKGNTQRKTGATDWNERSSRSHSVFTIVIESKPRDGYGDDDVRLSRLTLIDLAGSEKAVSDLERRGEGKHINRSLLALKTVINKLTDKKSGHIPYRDSKLTHLLENALGGDSNICVICTLSAEEEHHSETLETLKFAGNCARVETKAKKNILMSSEQALIQKKDKEIEILRRRLEGLVKDDSQSEASVHADQVQNLADSVAAMEARKSRLHTQLAKLNTQVLTSELPRAGSGIPSLPAGPKRRRISDLYSVMGASRVGLGSPKQKALDNRRAVSSALRMPQVPEDEMPAIHSQLDQPPPKIFDHDRIVSALRRALASRDHDLSARAAELDSTIQQVTQLQAELSALQSSSATVITNHDAALQEFHNKLESTRTELVATVNEKASKIDQLESTVLDLRTSREELLLEGEIRADELKAQLSQAVEESESLKTTHSTEMNAVRDELEATKSIASQVSSIQAKLAEADEHRRSVELALEKSQAANDERDTELVKARKAAELHTAELEKLRSENAARRGLEGDQAKLEAMLVGEREGRRMAEKDNRDLVDQLGELRELRLSQKAWQKDKQDLEAQLQIATSTSEEQRALIESLTNRSDDLVKTHAEVAKAADESHGKLKAVERELHDQSQEVYRLQMDLSTKTAESSNRINSLESQIMAEASRSQMLAESKAALETIVAEKANSLNLANEEIDKLRSTIVSSSSSTTEQVAMISSLEEQVRIESGARKTSDEVRIALEKEVVDLRAAVEGHETEVVRLCKDSEAARRSIESLKQDIEEERKAKSGVEAELQTMSGITQEREAQVASHAKELQSTRSKLEDQERQLAELSRQLEAARRSLAEANTLASSTTAEQDQQIKAFKMEIATLEKDVQARSTAMADAQAVIGTQNAIRKQLETDLATLRAERAQIESTLGEDYKALQGCLDSSAKEISGMKADLEAAHTERQRLQDQLDSSSKAGDGRVKEANETILSLRAQLKDTELQVGDVESRLQSEINNKTKMEMQLKAAVAEGAEKDSSIKQIQGQLATRQKEFEAQQVQLANIKADLASKTVALTTAEKTSMTTAEEKRQLSTKLVSIQEENTMHRSALAACQSQLEKSLADLAASNLVSKKLSEDLSIARATEAATRPRHASTPTNSHAGTGVLDSLRVQALRSATTGDDGLIQEKLKTKEKSEIERLEKIIEAQKEVIDDQREKIKFWAKELEQQREIVRMLTLTQDGNATPTKNSPRATHAKSKSMSAANLESPGPGSSHARVHLPNSFTAKNLALPTTPTPLPMHPSQFSNTSNRRGRRITIDHDMDLLTETSKVNKAKAVFDSPEKEERAAIALSRKKTVRLPAYDHPTGSPVQRRP